MDRSRIMVTRRPYDDAAWHVELFADNGFFAAIQDFYTHPEDLMEFGRKLTNFPETPSDQARFELGSPSANVAYYVLLRAYLYDTVGHAALEIFFDNNRKAPFAAKANFHIKCDVAALNRLGEALRDWPRDSGEPLTWHSTW